MHALITSASPQLTLSGNLRKCSLAAPLSIHHSIGEVQTKPRPGPTYLTLYIGNVDLKEGTYSDAPISCLPESRVQSINLLIL